MRTLQIVGKSTVNKYLQFCVFLPNVAESIVKSRQEIQRK